VVNNNIFTDTIETTLKLLCQRTKAKMIKENSKVNRKKHTILTADAGDQAVNEYFNAIGQIQLSFEQVDKKSELSIPMIMTRQTIKFELFLFPAPVDPGIGWDDFSEYLRGRVIKRYEACQTALRLYKQYAKLLFNSDEILMLSEDADREILFTGSYNRWSIEDIIQLENKWNLVETLPAKDKGGELLLHQKF
jgi:hypothetical protein